MKEFYRVLIVISGGLLVSGFVLLFVLSIVNGAQLGGWIKFLLEFELFDLIIFLYFSQKYGELVISDKEDKFILRKHNLGVSFNPHSKIGKRILYVVISLLFIFMIVIFFIPASWYHF